jgi:hypothetical protein
MTTVDIARPTNAALDEIERLMTGETYQFGRIIDGFKEAETYFASPLGFVVRVLRSDLRFAGSHPAYIQFFDFEGRPLGAWTKFIESATSFALGFSDSINESKLCRLSGRPAFVNKPNTTSFHQVVPRSQFGADGIIGDLNVSSA